MGTGAAGGRNAAFVTLERKCDETEEGSGLSAAFDPRAIHTGGGQLPASHLAGLSAVKAGQRDIFPDNDYGGCAARCLGGVDLSEYCSVAQGGIRQPPPDHYGGRAASVPAGPLRHGGTGPGDVVWLSRTEGAFGTGGGERAAREPSGPVFVG